MQTIKLTFKDSDGDEMTVTLDAASVHAALNELADKGWETGKVVAAEVQDA